MKNEKLKKADLLLDAVGEIDDVYLENALSYKRKRGVSSRILIIAATLAMSLTLIVCTVIGARLALKNDVIGSSPSDKNEAEVGERNDPLESLMVNLSNKEGFTRVESETELPYTDGNAYIVWQYEGESGYYLSEALSVHEIDYLKTQIGRGEEVGGSSPKLECKMWILLGDGRVVSPHLKVTTGNISSTVFDYEAEITPTDGLVDRIAAILS